MIMTDVFRKNELEEIIKKHFPTYDVLYYYTQREWKILETKLYYSKRKIIHRVPLPENWKDITEEEFDDLIILSQL